MPSQTEIRQRITDQVVAALKAGGIPPWRKTWSDLENTGLPTNVVSKKPYSGINRIGLSIAASAKGWSSKWYGTMRQWNERGFRVRKRPDHIPPGEWAERAVFFKRIEKVTETEEGDEELERFFVLREYYIFNAQQCEGPGIEKYLAKPANGTQQFIDYQPAEEVITATGADIRFGGSRAFYSPQGDFIQLPPKESFSAAHQLYAVEAHELCHWTGHESRLSRLNKLARFGDKSYAMEELVAELGSAFLLAELGIPQSEDLSNVTAYLADWLKVLEGNHSAVFTAAAAASKAVEFIQSFSQTVTQPEDDESLTPAA